MGKAVVHITIDRAGCIIYISDQAHLTNHLNYIKL
jgi:hypothetical protein